MKSILVAMALVLMTTGTASAHGEVSFQIGFGIPLYYPYSYPTYYPAPYAYYYPAPSYGYYYPGPYTFYPYYPYHGSIVVHGGFGHRHFVGRGGRFHDNHFGFDHGRRFGR